MVDEERPEDRQDPREDAADEPLEGAGSADDQNSYSESSYGGEDQGSGAGGPSDGRPPLPLVGGLAAAVIVGIIIIFVALSGGGDDGPETAGADPSVVPSTSTPTDGTSGGLATGVPSPEATLDLTVPTVSAAVNLDSVGDSDRLVVPLYGIEAPLTLRTVGQDGVMTNPDGPDDVAYYNFSAWPGKGGAPGLGGNSVFAGHVDSGTKACDNGNVPPPCQAVFWDISALRVGDEVQIHIDGVIYSYAVTSNQSVVAATAPWDKIVSATEQETITLITCGGDFNRETREYNNRQVVVAVRIS